MKQAVYGYPCVEDPHDFHPDFECCTEAEIEMWRLACLTYGTYAYQPNKGCYAEYGPDGQLVKHVLRTSWGIGTNMVDMDQFEGGECASCDHDEHRHHAISGACLEIGCECARFGGPWDATLSESR